MAISEKLVEYELYNNIKAPPMKTLNGLANWNSSYYVVLLRTANGQIQLHACSSKFYIGDLKSDGTTQTDAASNVLIAPGKQHIYVPLPADDSKWCYSWSPNTLSNLGSPNNIVWANYDLMDTNTNTIYISSSTPIPVTETVVTKNIFDYEFNPYALISGLSICKHARSLRQKADLFPPTLSKSWYKGSKAVSDYTAIHILDAYVPTGDEFDSWYADENGAGSIICYSLDTELYITGNGTGSIYLSNGYYTFSGFTGVTSISGLDLLDTRNITNAEFMFYNCKALTELDLSSFNTANVTDMDCMFRNCQSLTSLDLSSFNTANVTSMGSMFDGCQSLTSLDLSSFNTANVTIFGFMFTDCELLETIDLSNFDTANVTSMAYMFARCKALTELDLSTFNTVNVSNMNGMFKSATALKAIYVGDEWTTTNATTSSMFTSCGVSGVTLKQ